MQLSKRSNVDAFLVMDVVEAATKAEAQGADVVHMEVGQPGTAAPRGAREALAHAMEHDSLGYSVSLGIPELRERIAQLYFERHGLSLDPARIIVTSGSSGGFVLAFTALFDPGERIALGRPGYPSYRQILRALALEPVEIETGPETRFQPDPASLPNDINGLIVASPANPSGTMLDKAGLGGLIDACNARGASFISDEIYHGIDYERSPVSALEVSDDLIVINSFSKYYSMTGWRVGWMVVPDDMVRPFERLQQNLFICAPHASQVAALAALDCEPELQDNLAVYARNRKILIDGLPEAGLPDFAPPDGAFYIYVDVSKYTQDSVELANDILQSTGVAVTPGVDFDPVRGRQTLRLSYAGSTERIDEGLRRLRQYFLAL